MVRAFVVMMAMLGTGVMVSTPVGAEPAEREVVPASENAALVYWAGWYWLGEYRRTLSDLYYSEDGLFVPENQNEEEALRALTDASQAVEVIIRASKMEHCDFGSRPEHALNEDREPSDFYLNVARETSRIVALDAGRHLERNWTEEGAERLAALVRLAEHIGRAEMPSPSLVSISIFDTAARHVDLFQDKFSEKDRRVLSEALERFPEEDTFRLVAGVGRDAAVSAQRLANQIRTRDVSDWTLEGTGLDGALASVKAESESALGNTRTARLARARLIRDAMRIAEVGEKYAEAWGDPAAIDAVYDELAAGDYGVFARSMAGVYGKLSQVDTEANAKLDALRAWANGETETLELPERNRR